MAAREVDLFVIGGGSGGVRAARIAAGHGARVMLAEEYRVGGTCVIRGCVPKKLLVYASRFRDDFEDAAGFGWSVSPPSFDWPTLIANKDAEIARLEGLYRSGLERAGVTIMQARAELADAHTLTVQPRDPKILRGFDEELRDHLTEELFKRRIDVVCNAEIAAIDKGWTHLNVTRKDGSTVETGKVMYATGRVPNTKGLGLETAGVKLGD